MTGRLLLYCPHRVLVHWRLMRSRTWSKKASSTFHVPDDFSKWDSKIADMFGAMSAEVGTRYQIDILANQAGGYFSAPGERELAYIDLLFSVCEQFGIRYYSATPKERYFWPVSPGHGIRSSPQAKKPLSVPLSPHDLPWCRNGAGHITQSCSLPKCPKQKSKNILLKQAVCKRKSETISKHKAFCSLSFPSKSGVPAMVPWVRIPPAPPQIP